MRKTTKKAANAKKAAKVVTSGTNDWIAKMCMEGSALVMVGIGRQIAALGNQAKAKAKDATWDNVREMQAVTRALAKLRDRVRFKVIEEKR